MDTKELLTSLCSRALQFRHCRTRRPCHAPPAGPGTVPGPLAHGVAPCRERQSRNCRALLHRGCLRAEAAVEVEVKVRDPAVKRAKPEDDYHRPPQALRQARRRILHPPLQPPRTAQNSSSAHRRCRASQNSALDGGLRHPGEGVSSPCVERRWQLIASDADSLQRERRGHQRCRHLGGAATACTGS